MPLIIETLPKEQESMKVSKTFKLSLVAAIGWTIPQMTLAQGVGNLGSLPGPTIPMTNPGGWDLGNPANPIPVQRDPNGPVWLKHFSDPAGGPLVVTNPGTTFNLHETLVIAPNLPWSDWHENILTPGWAWSPNISFLIWPNMVPPAGLTVTNTPGNFTQGDSLEFLFNSLPPGTIIDIRKELVWQGIPGITQFVGHIDVAQFPTPEPASMLLVVAGSALALRRRRCAPHAETSC
jgi:hypothetical protein